MRRFLNLFKNKPKAQFFHLVRAVGLVVRLLWEQKRTAEREDPHALLRPHGECGFPTKSGKTKFCKVPPKTKKTGCPVLVRAVGLEPTLCYEHAP